MGILSETRLTAGYAPELEASIALSVPGMAHFAATGPEGTTCHGCQFWGKSIKFKRDAGYLLPRRCVKFASLSGGARVKEGVPPGTSSCRHYVSRDPAPAIFSERTRKPKA